MPTLYIPTRAGSDALLELDQVEWQPLSEALGQTDVPKLLKKITSQALHTREEVITVLEYSREYRSQTEDKPTTPQMIPFLLAMTADSTVAWRRETMRAAVLACEWALKLQRASVLAAARASTRWLQVIQDDPSDAIAYGAKMMSSIRSNMTDPKQLEELAAVDEVLSNEAYNEALDADQGGRHTHARYSSNA